MEIHAPEGPVHSWKDFVIHIVMITIGVLIALSAEGITEWMHHRSLVQEAQMNLQQEIRDNKQEIDSFLKSFSESRKQHEEGLKTINDLLAHKKMRLHEFKLSLNSADLSAAAWNTAGATGALGHMEYSEVQKYAKVYDSQRVFSGFQEQLLRSLPDETPFTDPSTASVPELEGWRLAIGKTLNSLQVEESIAKQLSTAYDKMLSEK